jgi:hypothetical protein
VLLVPKIYGEIVLSFDFLILTTALLFRKSKPKPVKSTSDPKSLRLIGYYLTISAIALLVLNHYVSFMSLLDYYEGLAIDSFIFYMGLKVIQHE